MQYAKKSSQKAAIFCLRVDYLATDAVTVGEAAESEACAITPTAEPKKAAVAIDRQIANLRAMVKSPEG